MIPFRKADDRAAAPQTLFFYSNTLKNNRTRLDFIRRRRAFAVYARERKPLLSRAQTFIITSVNLCAHDKKGRRQVFAAFCLKGRRKKQGWKEKNEEERCCQVNVATDRTAGAPRRRNLDLL